MPEAAVNEQGESLAGEHEIGITLNTLVPTPAGEADGAEQLYHPDFRFLVPA